MRKYVIKRILQLIPILFAITFLSYGMMRIAGSDVVTQKMENTGGVVSEETLDAAREQLGLDKPFLTQYFVWLGKLLRGNMGNSYVSGFPVFDTFVSKLPATLLLTVTSILLTIVISIPLGILSAVKQNTVVDYLIRLCSFIGNSLPNFFVSLLLMYFLAIRLRIFPVIAKDVSLKSVAMPAITLAIAMSAKYLRQVRATVLDELSKDYVAGAKARGVKFSVTLWKSIMKASLVTIITLLMLSVGNLLGGTAIVESIFMWDGVGKMAVDAICYVDGDHLCSGESAYGSVLSVPGSKNSSGRCKAVSKRKNEDMNVRNTATTEYGKKVTVRVQKVKKSHIKQKLVFFTVLAVCLVILAVFSDHLCPYDPYAQDLSSALQAPSLAHPMGTDTYGRDMLSRVISGARASIFSTFILVAVISIFGTIVGVGCGYYGGIMDSVMMRISDVCLAFPGLVFAMAIAAILGGGIQNAIIALAVISWPKYSRIARSQTLALKNEPYIHAAILSGDSSLQIMLRHVFPNMLGPVLVTAMLDIGTMMMELAGLSFLGLGAQIPMAEWGSMMSSGRSMIQTYPWVVLSPGIAIFVSVVIFNLLGDTVRDYLDPKNREAF